MIDNTLDLPLIFDDKLRKETNPQLVADIVPLDCRKCGRFSTRKCVIRGTGSFSPEVMYIGPQPAEADDASGFPYSGEDGIILDRILKKSGIDRKDIYITYSTKCYAGVAKPPVKDIKACFHFLDKEIRSIVPKLVIVEGVDLLKFLFKDRSMRLDLMQGSLSTLPDYPGILFMPIYSLSAVFADPNHETQIIRNIQRGLTAVRNGLPKKVPEHYTYVETEEDLDRLLALIQDRPVLSLDIETDGKPSFMDTRVTCWSISWLPGQAAYFPWLDDGNIPHWPADAHARLVDKWNKFLTGKKLVLHNGKYDLKILKKNLGVDSGEYFADTVISTTLLDETQLNKKLKNLAWVYTSMGGYDDELEKVKQQLGVTKDYSLIPRSILKSYVCRDADCTLRIYLAQRDSLKAKGLEFLFHCVYMPISQIFMNLEYEGVPVDREYLSRLKQDYEARLQDLEVQIHTACGTKFQVTSDEQLANVLFHTLGLPVIRMTKTQESTDKDSLTKLRGKHPVIDLLLEYRSRATLLNTFVIPLLAKSEKDGRIHTEYKVGVNSTSRTSSSAPNMQNLPRTNKDIKKAFIARPGYLYYEFDFSQIEIRVLAHLSRDQKLVSDLNSGLDIHKAMASTVYSVSPDRVTKDMRSASKSVSFGIIYGMSWKTLAEDKGMSKIDAKRLYDNFFRGYSGVADWIANVKRFALEHKCVYTPFGRIRRLDGIDHPLQVIRGGCERCAVNSPIQSMGADIPNLAIIKLLRTYPESTFGYKFHFQIHDAAVLEIPQATHLDFFPKVKELMETAEKLVVPTPVGIKRGLNLGEMEEIA